MKIKAAVILSMFFTLAACSDAKQAAEVAPTFVSTSKYDNLSCSNLRAEAERVNASVASLEGSVDKAYKRDKGMEAAAWILFWPAALAMKGNDGESGQLAQAKGDSEAIRSALLKKGCRP